jgi:hypothetical protein
MKSPKKKLRIFATIILAMWISGIYTSAISGVQAAEPSIQEKATFILNDIADFNMTTYTPTLRSSRQGSFLTLHKEVNDFTLVSSDTSCRAMFTFVNKRLQQIYMSNYSGQPKLNQLSLNTLESAKAFMAKCNTNLADFNCDTMRSLLDSIQTEENITKTYENTKLMVTVIDQSYVEYIWTYVDGNGVPAPLKNVVLSYRDGFLKCFQNNWQFYSVASKPGISSDQAVAIAMNAIDDYSTIVLMPDNTTKTVSGFKVHSIGQTMLNYQNYHEADLARGGDSFALYPTWIVPLGFDKIYDGSVSGAHVQLWADTCEVSDVSPITVGNSYMPDGELKPADMLSNFGALLMLAGLSCGTVLCLKLKRSSWSSMKATRKPRLQVVAILLCASITVSVVSAGFPTAEASNAAYVYASLYGQLQDEVNAAADVCDFLEDVFDDAGYNSVENAYGDGTVEDDILSNAEYAEDNYDFVTVFHFGHMNGSSKYFDNDGITVSYEDIDDYTTQGKHYFAFMWVCDSSYDDNLAEAWCYDLYDGDHCYLGFWMASPTLESLSYTFQGAWFAGQDEIYWIYYYALIYDYSIYDACDQMSYTLVGGGIESIYSVAYFWTYWCYNDLFPDHGEGWAKGFLVGYGNPDIYLT